MRIESFPAPAKVEVGNRVDTRVLRLPILLSVRQRTQVLSVGVFISHEVEQRVTSPHPGGACGTVRDLLRLRVPGEEETSRSRTWTGGSRNTLGTRSA